MLSKDALIFVEVRLRRSKQFGGAAASVDERKRRKLARTAQHFLARHRRFANFPVRFDVIAIDGAGTIDWIEDAFWPQVD